MNSDTEEVAKAVPFVKKADELKEKSLNHDTGKI